MIIGISGEVVKKEPTSIDIKLDSGLIYRVLISLNSSAKIDSKKVTLHTTYIVREDSQRLYGFKEIDEKGIFDRVLKINGVGPSTALAICSTLTPYSFVQALANQDIDAFKKVPGIGPKSAKRILIELSDFTPTLEGDEEVLSHESNKYKAILALESLGFKKETIKKALVKSTSVSVEDLIKDALRMLK